MLELVALPLHDVLLARSVARLELVVERRRALAAVSEDFVYSDAAAKDFAAAAIDSATAVSSAEHHRDVQPPFPAMKQLTSGVRSQLSLHESALLTADLIDFASTNYQSSQQQGQSWRCRSLLPASVWLPPDTDVTSSTTISKTTANLSESSSIMSVFGSSATSSASSTILSSGYTNTLSTNSTSTTAASKSSNRWLSATLSVGKVSIDAATFGLSKTKNKGASMLEQKSLPVGPGASTEKSHDAHVHTNPLTASITDNDNDRACAAVFEMFPKLDLSTLRSVVTSAMERAAERGFEAGEEVYDTALAEVIELAMAGAISEVVEMPQKEEEAGSGSVAAIQGTTSRGPCEAGSLDNVINGAVGLKKSTDELNENGGIVLHDTLAIEEGRLADFGGEKAESSTASTLDISSHGEIHQDQLKHPDLTKSATIMDLIELRNRAQRLQSASNDASREAALALTAVEAASRAAEMVARENSASGQTPATPVAEMDQTSGQMPSSDSDHDELLNAAAAGVAAAAEVWCTATAHVESCQAEATRAADELAEAEAKVAAAMGEEAPPSRPLLPSIPSSAAPAIQVKPAHKIEQASASTSAGASNSRKDECAYPWIRQVRLAAESAHLELRTTVAESPQHVRAPLLRVGLEGLTFSTANKSIWEQQRRKSTRLAPDSTSSSLGGSEKESYRCTVAQVEVLQWLTSEVDPTAALRRDEDARQAALAVEREASLAAAAKPLIDAALAAAHKDACDAAAASAADARRSDEGRYDGSSGSSRGGSEEKRTAPLSSSRSELSEAPSQTVTPALQALLFQPSLQSGSPSRLPGPQPEQPGKSLGLPRGVSVEAAQMGGPILLENCGSKRLLFAAGGKLRWQAGVGCLSPGQRCARGQEACLTWELLDAPHHAKHAKSAVHQNSAGCFVFLNSGSRRKLYASNFRPSTRLFRHELLPIDSAMKIPTTGSASMGEVSSRVRVRRSSGIISSSEGSNSAAGGGSVSDEEGMDEPVTHSPSLSAEQQGDSLDAETALAQTAAVWSKHVGCGAPDARASADHVWRLIPSDRPLSNGPDSTSTGHQGPRYFLVNAESERYLFARPVRQDPRNLKESYGAIDLGAAAGANSHNAAAVGFGAVGSRSATSTPAGAPAAEGPSSFGQPATDPYLEWQLVLPTTYAAAPAPAVTAATVAPEGTNVAEYSKGISSNSSPTNMPSSLAGANLGASGFLNARDVHNSSSPARPAAAAAAAAAAVPEAKVEPAGPRERPPPSLKSAMPVPGDATVLLRSGSSGSSCSTSSDSDSASSSSSSSSENKSRNHQPAFFAVDFAHTPGIGRKRGRWSISAAPQDLQSARLEGGIGPRLHTLFSDPQRLADPNLLPESDDEDEDDDDNEDDEEEGEEWEKEKLETDRIMSSSRRLPAVMVAAEEWRKLQALEKVLAAAGQVWAAGSSFAPFQPAKRVHELEASALHTGTKDGTSGIGGSVLREEQQCIAPRNIRTPLQSGKYEWARWFTHGLTSNDARLRVTTPLLLLRLEEPLTLAKSDGSCEGGHWDDSDDDGEDDDEDDGEVERWRPSWNSAHTTSLSTRQSNCERGVAVSSMRFAPVVVEAQQRNRRVRVRVKRDRGSGGGGRGTFLEQPLAEIDLSHSRVNAARAVEATLAAAFPGLDLGAVLGK